MNDQLQPRPEKQQSKPQTLRRQLILRLCIFLSIILLLGGFGVFYLFRAKIYTQFDTNLQFKTQVLRSLVRALPSGEIGIFDQEELSNLISRKRQLEYYEVRVDDKVVAAAPWLHGQALPLDVDSDIESLRAQNVSLSDGTAIRGIGIAYALPLSTAVPKSNDSSHQVSLRVARRSNEVQEAVQDVAALMALIVAASVAATAVVIAWTIGAGLRPLQQLADRVQHIHAESLDERLSATGAPNELQPIVQRLNELFERLHEAFERERRFSANIAHELRTPIAELLAECEVALKWPGNRDELIAAISGTHSVGLSMASAIETLLALSRCQNGKQLPALDAIDINHAFVSEWDRVLPTLEEMDVKASTQLDCKYPMMADRQMMRLVLANLLSNAAAYTAPGGEVIVRSYGDATSVTLEVLNCPHGLDATDLKLLFEPFWRKGQARSEREHTGLGLALCRALCEAQGIECTAQLTSAGFLCMRVNGPAAESEMMPQHQSFGEQPVIA